jgi:putative phage-type endonuclease
MSDRTDWLAWRRSGIGASDVAGILGLSPWASPFSVWASKIDDQADDHDNDAKEFGRRAEVMVGPWFTDRTGLTVAGEQARCTHRDDRWKLCTVDGFVLDGPNSDIASALGVLEIKTTGDSAADWAVEVPVHYRCQATWAMHVTDLPRCWFAVLHLAFGRPRFEFYEFERDAAEEAFVVDACSRFWHDHVATGHPPAVDGHSATTDAIKAHWPTAEGSLEADALTRRMCDRIRAHKATAKLIEANIAEAENELRAALGDREALVDGTGKVLASWKPQSTARLDGKALKAARPDIAAEYTTTTTTRVLRVKNLEE